MIINELKYVTGKEKDVSHLCHESTDTN